MSDKLVSKKTCANNGHAFSSIPPSPSPENAQPIPTGQVLLVTPGWDDKHWKNGAGLLGHALETGIGLLEKELKEKTQKLKDQEDEVKKAKEVISELESLREDFRKLSLEKERAVGDLADLEKEKVKSDTLLSEKTKLLEVAEEKLAAEQKDRKEESDHLKAEITFQYEQGFEKAIDQVKFLHLEINVDEAGAFKEIRDGQLVDIPDEE
ncbi:hypothetical protein SESBI_26808 [Sesbania bispinosa]|nr:hypothetical protein SESBI_26808 [Sesbania bispinosa]